MTKNLIILQILLFCSFTIINCADLKAHCTYHMYNKNFKLTGCSCSDGQNGLMTRWGYKDLSEMYPYVTAYSGLKWNSPNCGQCFRVDWKGQTVYVTAIDQCGPPTPQEADVHFDISPEAFKQVFGDEGIQKGSLIATYSQVDPCLCKGNKDCKKNKDDDDDDKEKKEKEERERKEREKEEREREEREREERERREKERREKEEREERERKEKEEKDKEQNDDDSDDDNDSDDDDNDDFFEDKIKEEKERQRREKEERQRREKEERQRREKEREEKEERERKEKEEKDKEQNGESEKCNNCWPGTIGYCKAPNTVCYNKIDYGGGNMRCPAGTFPCKNQEKQKEIIYNECIGCWYGTSGVCKAANTVCYGRQDYGSGDMRCPSGTSNCE